jgi:hypothetical protein
MGMIDGRGLLRDDQDDDDTPQERVIITGGYSPGSLHCLPGDALFKIVSNLHCALVGLLWLIDDLKNFDELMHESHFSDTVPMHRAQEVHRLLCKYTPKELIERGVLDSEIEEFRKWWERCAVGESFTTFNRHDD